MKPIIAELATKLGVTVYALDKWKARKAVPDKWRFKLYEAAKKEGKRLTNADMDWRDALDKQAAK